MHNCCPGESSSKGWRLKHLEHANSAAAAAAAPPPPPAAAAAVRAAVDDMAGALLYPGMVSKTRVHPQLRSTPRMTLFPLPYFSKLEKLFLLFCCSCGRGKMPDLARTKEGKIG